jgi:hypothetical protein
METLAGPAKGFHGQFVAVMVTVSEADSAPSLTVSFNTYVPMVELRAVVLAVLGVPKVTVPGPLLLLQT